jgi:hypothetical protein
LNDVVLARAAEAAVEAAAATEAEAEAEAEAATEASRKRQHKGATAAPSPDGTGGRVAKSPQDSRLSYTFSCQAQLWPLPHAFRAYLRALVTKL